MKEVIMQTVSQMGVTVEDEFLIEEKPILQENNDAKETMSTESVWEVQEEVDKPENDTGNMQIETITEEKVAEEVVDNKENGEEVVTEETIEESVTESTSEEMGTDEVTDTKELEEYVVKQGDTLVAICKIRYGSTIKMQEICEINNIKNADYIAPGQKIYLP